MPGTARSRGGAALLWALLLLLPPLLLGGLVGATVDTDNTFSEATPFSSSTGQMLGNVSVADDLVDFFSFEAQAGQVINTTAALTTGGSGDARLAIDLYGPSHALLDSSNRSGVFNPLQVLVVRPGTHFVALRAIAGSSAYILDLAVEDPTPLLQGFPAEASLVHSSRTEYRWFALSLQGGPSAEHANITITAERSGAQLDARLADRVGDRSQWVDLQWGTGTTLRLEGSASYTGTYYVRLQADSGSFDLSLSLLRTNRTSDNDNQMSAAPTLSYNTTRTGGVDEANDTYDWVHVDLLPGEGLTATLTLRTWSWGVYSLLLFSPNGSLWKEATNFVFSTPRNLTDRVVLTAAPTPSGPYGLVVAAKVGLAEDPEDLSDDAAIATYQLDVLMSLHPPRPPNHAPVLIHGGPATLSLREDEARVVDVRPFFADPESDPLTIAVNGGAPLRLSIDDDGLVTILPPKDYAGCSQVSLSATDPGGLAVSTQWQVCVQALPEPPQITAWAPAGGDPLFNTTSQRIEVPSGTTVPFSINFSDPDTPLAELEVGWYWSTVQSTDGGQLVASGGASFAWTPTAAQVGTSLVFVRVDDGGRTAERQWRVLVSEGNTAPFATSISPDPAATVRTDPSRPVIYTVTLEDPDGDDTLHWRWILDGQEVANGSGTHTQVRLGHPMGEHAVILEYTDGTVTKQVQYAVRSEPPGGLDGGIWALVLSAVAIGLGVGAHRRLLTWRVARGRNPQGRAAKVAAAKAAYAAKHRRTRSADPVRSATTTGRGPSGRPGRRDRR